MVSVDGYSGAYPIDEITPAASAPTMAPPAAARESFTGDTGTGFKDPIETFLANGRLQINANVGLDGIGRLKQMLNKYEELLKLMN
jgi:hypothetical protein